MQRQLFRHGLGIITAGFVLGAVTGAVGMPHARLWVGSHVTAIMTGMFVCVVAAAWSHVTLGERAQRVVYVCTSYGNWLAFGVLGVFAPLAGFPLKTATPDLPPAPAWANAVVGLGLAVTTITLFTTCALMLYGLRDANDRANHRANDAVDPVRHRVPTNG